MDEEDIIRQLVEETRSLPRRELPGAWDWAKGHPGILSHRTKSAWRYDQDMRRAHFLEQAQKRAKDTFWSSPEMLRSSSEMESLKSPYQPYGADWPISNFGRYMGSMQAMPLATGQMLANKVDPVANPYPNAPDDYAKNMNNLAGIIPFIDGDPFGKNKNHMRDMQEMRDAQDAIPWNAIVPRELTDNLAVADYEKRAEPKTGSEFLSEAGVNGTTGALWGAVMDATLDPLMFPAKSWGGLALDYGLGTAHGTVPVAVETIRRLRY